MPELPIIDAVKDYIKENNVLFCTPGHKGGKGFSCISDYGFAGNILEFDLTEVEGLDNLQNPEEAVKESCQLLSRFYGSYKSYYLINGSTMGNLIMIFSSFNEGDKILLERNCHKSVYNAVIMRKLKPVFIQNVVSDTMNAPMSIDMEHFLYIIKNEKDIKGMVVTYPNYYGFCCDLEFISGKCREKGIKLLVDSAHGAHFGISSKVPESAVKLGADMVVHSAHKTLPSLTQTSYLHVCKNTDIDKVEFYFRAFSSTSPSYIFLCSLEYARYYLEMQGKKDYDNLVELAENYRDKINTIKHVHIIGKDDIAKDGYKHHIKDMDATRYVINLEKGYSGHLLLKYLRSCGIQAEMSDDSNVVLILSPFNNKGDFEKLYSAIKDCDFNEIKTKSYDIIKYNIPEIKMDPYEALSSVKRYMNYHDAEGCISGDNITPYPPGIPLLMMGEKIDKTHIELINRFMDTGVSVMGIDKDKLLVIDKNMEE